MESLAGFVAYPLIFPILFPVFPAASKIPFQNVRNCMASLVKFRFNEFKNEFGDSWGVAGRRIYSFGDPDSE
jgi:hypothetical protein